MTIGKVTLLNGDVINFGDTEGSEIAEMNISETTGMLILTENGKRWFIPYTSIAFAVSEEIEPQPEVSA